MLVTITTHDLHHEAKRLFEMGRAGYESRFDKITRVEKWAAVIMFATYRMDIGYPGDMFWPGVVSAVGRRLLAMGVSEIEIKESRCRKQGRECAPKSYRIDEWVIGR